MKDIAIMTDIHGCYKTLMALVAKLPKDAEIVLLGDLIDRGPDSRHVVYWAMHNKIPCTMGNHEDLAVAYSGHVEYGFRPKCGQYYEHDIWLYNGGDKALDSWGADLLPKSQLPENVVAWMASRPAYLKMPGRLLLSHTGYGLDSDINHWFPTLWGRYPHDGQFAYEPGSSKPTDDGYFRVFGHTRVKEPIITKTYANIDTGCAYTGYGKLTALLWPSMEIIQQDNIE